MVLTEMKIPDGVEVTFGEGAKVIYDDMMRVDYFRRAMSNWLMRRNEWLELGDLEITYSPKVNRIHVRTHDDAHAEYSTLVEAHPDVIQAWHRLRDDYPF